MTVIAWDGKMLAADKRLINGSLINTTTKIERIGKLLVGAAGMYVAGLETRLWIKRGRKAKDFPKIQLDRDDAATIMVIDGCDVFVYERSTCPIRIETKFWAIGSGRDFAIAAMHCGKSAKEAVEIASVYDTGCGNGVDVLFPNILAKK